MLDGRGSRPAAARDDAGRFLPGESGNLAGRPVTKGAARAAAWGDGLGPLLRLVIMMLDPAAPWAMRLEAEAQLRRGWRPRPIAVLSDAEIEAEDLATTGLDGAAG